MITGRQLRAARALLGWEAEELARKADVSRNTISKVENGQVTPRDGSLEKIMRAFETAGGVEFTENEGVRFRPSDIEVYEGPERFDQFTEFLYEYLKRKGGEVCVSTVDERLFAKYRKNHELHRARMKELVKGGRVRYRILATESSFTSEYAQHRWQPRQSSVPTSFYAFGDCLALISFVHEPSPYVLLIKSGPFAEAYRQAFNAAWNSAKPPPKTKGRKS
jgi:transcriptional regulator with XRE-family HTH domain